ncbi:MAG: cupredoxin domain-containing protein [Solirubrobacterales bacterium]
MKFVIGTIATAALLLAGASTAQGATTIVASDACCTFIDGPFTQEAGEVAIFSNPSTADATHNVLSTKNAPDGQPLFESKAITPGGTTPVKGTQYLEDGSYPFYCSIHTLSMSGDLVVSGGTPLPRPEPVLKAAIPTQKLKKVRKSGRFKVTLKNPGDATASGIALSITKGKKKLGSMSGISVKAGATKTVSVKLTGRGKKAIRKGKKILFQVKAAYRGGKPATAKRDLR